MPALIHTERIRRFPPDRRSDPRSVVRTVSRRRRARHAVPRVTARLARSSP